MRHIKFADGSKLVVGDCFRFLEKMEDGTIDLTVSSPPYCMGKVYERGKDLGDFIEFHTRILPLIARKTKEGGSICWQVGNHVLAGSIAPLDFYVHRIMLEIEGMALRNRIAWTFGHGTHARKRLSGRYETILWYTKGDRYYFDLDPIRVPQKYPVSDHIKGLIREILVLTR